jgi:tetratricopeptide (TPR) repeat protein
LWARRTKALILASSPDPQRVRGALAVLEPPGQAALAGAGQKAVEGPDDLRVLALVLSKQKTDQDRQRAIDILKSLVTKNIATPDDRIRLAELYEIGGNWDKAREEYLALNVKTRNARDLESLNLRLRYLLSFANKCLLLNRSAGNEQSLADVQDVIDELKQIQPDARAILKLQVELYRARNQLDKAVELIRSTADRPNLDPAILAPLGELAERVDNLELAEQLYKKLAALGDLPKFSAMPDAPNLKRPLVLFLAKHRSLKDALDICEPLWASGSDLAVVAHICVEAVTISARYDEQQSERVVAWIGQALQAAEAQNGKLTPILLTNLGSVRERQARYQEAQDCYKKAVDKGGVPTAYNNLAWLMVLRNEAPKDALAFINRVTGSKGPLLFDFLDTRGVIYMALNQPEMAINDLERAVKDDPAPARLFHLAQAYRQANKPEKAKEHLQAAKLKGLPLGIHDLEKPAYEKFVAELGAH